MEQQKRGTETGNEVGKMETGTRQINGNTETEPGKRVEEQTHGNENRNEKLTEQQKRGYGKTEPELGT